MITEKKNYRSAFSFPADIGVQFDQNRDIVDVYDLIRTIEQINETNHLRSIYEYLAKELPSWIIRIGDTEDQRPRETELYDRLFSIFENDRKGHPSIRMMDPDPSLFPKGLPEIFSDGRLAVEDVEEKEDPRAIKDMILDSWKREDRKHILLIGEGGIGKTVAMLTLPVEDWFKEFGIPVIYIPLQRLDAFHGDLNRYIREKIGYDNYDCCIEQANNIPEGHPRLLLLLDGFNEIPDKYKKAVEKCIREWMERPGIQLITTSRMGYFQENCFLKYQLKPLPHDTVKSFLLSAGIVEEQIPEQNDRIWKVINVPLMLTIFTQIEKVREAADRFSAVQIFEWKQPENAARIIWNYLQTELYRCIKKQDPSHSALQYAAAILTIAPYVCCQMSYQYKFYINMDEFHGLIREALNFYATHQNLLSRQMTNLRQKYDRHHEENLFRQEDAAEYARILIDNVALFQEQETFKEGCNGEYEIDYSCSLMHQNFRDSLAAFFICSCLPKTCDAKEERTLLGQADHYVKDYMAEYFSDQELVSIWDRHRIEDPEDGQITFILLDLIGRQRNYDYRELDLSRIDLTKTNLHSLLSRRLDICPLPEDKNKLKSTKISVNCLSPTGHAGYVESVSFSPDGRHVVSRSNRRLIIWDFESGEVHKAWSPAHWNDIRAVSPDGKKAAVCLYNETGWIVQVWNLESVEKRELRGQKDWINIIAFSPDERNVAIITSDGMSRIWSLESLECHVLEIHSKSSCESVAFSLNGTQILISAFDGTIWLWDLESGESHMFENLADWVVAFSPYGRQLVGGGELERGKSHVLEDITDWAWVAYSPDVSLLAGGDEHDEIIRLWNLESGKSLVLEGCASRIECMDYSPDGRQLAGGTSDGTIRLWDVESGETCVLERNVGVLNSVSFSPNGRQLVGGYESKVGIWDLESGESRILEGLGVWVKSFAFSRDGRQLVGVSSDRIVRIWDFENVENRVLEGLTNEIDTVSFSSDGRRFASTSNDGVVRVCDIESGEIYVLKRYADKVVSVAFSPDGRRLASGSNDGTVRVWDVESGENQILEGHTDQVLSVAFSPDGRRLASGSNDSTVRVWDVESGENQILEGHTDIVLSVAFSPDGRQLASSAVDGTVRIWDLNSGQNRVLEDDVEAIDSIDVSIGSRKLASGLNDGTIRVWNLESGESSILEDIVAKGNNTDSIAFSPDGKWLAGINLEQIWIWNLESGESLVLEGYIFIGSIAFSPDGMQLVISLADGSIWVWDLEKYHGVKKYVIISNINLSGANFELAIINEKDKEILRATGAKV